MKIRLTINISDLHAWSWLIPHLNITTQVTVYQLTTWFLFNSLNFLPYEKQLLDGISWPRVASRTIVAFKANAAVIAGFSVNLEKLGTTIGLVFISCTNMFPLSCETGQQFWWSKLNFLSFTHSSFRFKDCLKQLQSCFWSGERFDCYTGCFTNKMEACGFGSW